MRFGSGVGSVSCFLLFAMLGTVPAFSLTWYSYREPGGRIVVVDDPEKVPLECRASVRAEQVGRKKTPKSSQTVIPPVPASQGAVPSSLVADDPDLSESPSSDGMTLEEVPEEVAVAGTGKGSLVVEESKGRKDSMDSQDSKISKTASETPEMRAERVFVASAGLCLQELNGLHDKGELIWNIALRFGPTRPELRFQHSKALSTLAGPWMSWASQADHEKYREWLERVRILIEQYRTLFYTISHRLQTSPQSLTNELPPLLNRVRVNLEWVRQHQPIPPASFTPR